MKTLTNSQQLLDQAKKLIPGGVNSPVRAFKSVGGTPPFIKKAKALIFGTKTETAILIMWAAGVR